MRKTTQLVITKLAIIFFFLASNTIFAQNGSIKGRIYNSKNNESIPFANLIISGSNIGVSSDLDGNFHFTGVKPGYVKIAATTVGFEKFLSTEFMVISGKTKYVDIPMHEVAIRLAEVEIKTTTFTRDEESPLSMKSIGIAEIEKSPGGNRDISKVLQSLPGVASTPAFRNDVIVRGGGSSENRFYLDGIEIPNLNHFSTQGASGGPVGIINVDFLREIEFYSGAFPANKGNALSSFLDMRLIDGNPDKLKFKASIGASDLALTLDGPILKKTTFIFSARRSYLQFLFSALGLPFLPTYNDFQWKSKTKFDLKNELTVIGIGAIDQFNLNTGIKNPDENQKYILGYLPVFEQWNYAVGGVYKHYRTKSYDTYILSRNMLRNTSFKYPDNDESKSKILNYTSDEIENKFRFERNKHTLDYKLTFGAGLEYNRYNNKTFQKLFVKDSLITINYDSKIDLFVWNAFGQISKSFFADRLTLSLGIRMDANNYDEKMSNLLNQISPRISASYSLTEKLFLNANTGRYYQRPTYTTLGFRDNIGNLVNKQNEITYISVDHFVTGIDYLFNEKAKLSLEGFYKLYHNYPFSVNDSVSIASKGADYGTFGDEEVTSTSEGRAYGFELYYRNIDLMGFNVILSYTFVRSEFKEKNDAFIPSAWDNKHIMNLTLKKELGKNWDIGAKWRYVGGAPYTPVDFVQSSKRSIWDSRGRAYLNYDAFNSERLSDFNQLDIRVDKQYFFKKWSLNIYLDIQNLLAYKSEQQPIYTNLDIDGNIAVDPNDNTKYVLRKINDYSGNVLPTIGIIVEF
jgi:outer membrane receptor for ferrienterochelin and colicin